MLARKTAFVLGAGASMSYGFPSGHGLLVRILDLCQKAQTDDAVRQELRNAGCHPQSVIPLGTKIGPHFRSFDAFLEVNPKLSDEGKRLIAHVLLPYEHAQAFTPQTQAKNWMLYLFDAMKTKTIAEFCNNPITFVTFNYDRSLEFFLRWHLADKYHATKAEIDSAMKCIQIIHVHGKLGDLETVPYGGPDWKAKIWDVNPGQIMLRAAQGITILHEAQDDSDDFKLARKALMEAERIAFLGFGFHWENMRRLQLGPFMGEKDIYATRMEITDPELTPFIRLSSKSLADIAFVDGDSVALLRNTDLFYKKTLGPLN